MSEEKGKRLRVGITIRQDVMEKADANLQNANCKSRSEYIENAISFYTGYISADQNQHYFAKTISSLIEGIVENFINKLARLMFKEAVEQAKVFKMLARAYKYSPEEIEDIHRECIQEVKKVNGFIKLPPSQNWSDD